MSAETPFRCDLVFGSTWEEQVPDHALRLALAEPDYFHRIAAVVELFTERVQKLKERGPQPQVIVCAIPQEVIDVCSLDESFGEVRRVRLTAYERRAKNQRDAGQLSMFPVSLGDEDDDSPGHRNLRRALKAETMRFDIPTQVIRESTLTGKGTRSLQDEATRAWNFCTGLYYKAGGHPWRLADMPPDTCYIGVSFYKERLSSSPLMRTSLAQIFSHRTDGLVFRGEPFEWDRSMPSPHMPGDVAQRLIEEALRLYERHSERPPLRVVVHKSSRFFDEERTGFQEALKQVPHVDLVTLEKRGIQFFRYGSYPPVRGTWVKFDRDNHLLYTRGFVPFLRTYPGMRAPQPLELLEHHGDTSPDQLLTEIMALTKMNWNSADFACEEPMTLAFARKVGDILGELPPGPGSIPQAEYRFYM